MIPRILEPSQKQPAPDFSCPEVTSWRDMDEEGQASFNPLGRPVSQTAMAACPLQRWQMNLAEILRMLAGSSLRRSWNHLEVRMFLLVNESSVHFFFRCSSYSLAFAGLKTWFLGNMFVSSLQKFLDYHSSPPQQFYNLFCLFSLWSPWSQERADWACIPGDHACQECRRAGALLRIFFAKAVQVGVES